MGPDEASATGGRLPTGFPTLDGAIGGLVERGLNAALCQDQASKMAFLLPLCDEASGRGEVLYLDWDTLFTVYIMRGIFKPRRPEAVRILRPVAEGLDAFLAQLCGSTLSTPTLLVLDSVPSYQLLHSQLGEHAAQMGRLLGLHLDLLQQATNWSPLTVLVCTLPSSRREEGRWVQDYTAGRILRVLGSLVMMVGYGEEGLWCEVLKAPFSPPKGRIQLQSFRDTM